MNPRIVALLIAVILVMSAYFYFEPLIDFMWATTLPSSYCLFHPWKECMSWQVDRNQREMQKECVKEHHCESEGVK